MLWIMAGGFVWLVWVARHTVSPFKGGTARQGGWLGWVVGGVGRWLGSAGRHPCGRARVLHAWRIREVGGEPGCSFSLSYRESPEFRGPRLRREVGGAGRSALPARTLRCRGPIPRGRGCARPLEGVGGAPVPKK